MFGYSHAKRFTSWSHAWLGVALGLAPLSAWVAARGLDGSLAAPAMLGFGVVLWVLGFDVLYACQDEAFDREAGLHSVPARFGQRRALRIAAACHLGALPCFVAFGVLAQLGWPFHAAVAASALLLAYEHRIVKPDDLARLNVAFFHANAAVSVALLVGTACALWLPGSG